MIRSIHNRQSSVIYKILCSFVAFTFSSSVILPPPAVFAQTVLNLPVPGTMVAPSPGFMPVLMTGLTIHPDNPLRFDFIMDTGHSGLDIHSEEFKQESAKLIKYFMASLTTPEEELWVNLSPYEKDRMVPLDLGKTEMGRDMLAQDYLLKQLTASLMYPEQDLGKEFWKRVYQKAREKFGTTEIPLNTFNKIWIVPEDALVYEQDGSAFVIHSKLAVMLEEDYEALRQSKNTAELGSQDTVVSGLQSQVVREVLIPEITKEINEGKNFANLRQIFNALILATWYKVRLKESLLGKVYVNQGKTKGIDVQDKEINEKIYTQYLEAFQKGVYNYIREDYDESTQQIIPRKYFSGGVSAARTSKGKWLSQALRTGGLVLGLTAFSALPSWAQQKGRNVLAGVGRQAGVTAEFVENSPNDVTVTVRNGENVRPVLLAQVRKKYEETPGPKLPSTEESLKQKVKTYGHGAVPYLKKLYYEEAPWNPFHDSPWKLELRLAIVKAFGEAGLDPEDIPFLHEVLEGAWNREREWNGSVRDAVHEAIERIKLRSYNETIELKQRERVNGVYGVRLGVESSRMLDIKELTPLNAAEVFNDIVRLASESRKFRDINDPDALALARTLKYEKREDGHQISFKGKPILGQRASSQQLEIFKVNGNPAVHFTSTTIYLEIPGDSEHLLTIDRTNYFILRITRWEWEDSKDQLSFLGGKIMPELRAVTAGGERHESTLNLPDATVRIEGAAVDSAGVKFEGDVYIYNHAGQPVNLSEQAGRFFPKTPEGKPLVKDTVIVIKPSAEAVAAASPIASSSTGRKLTNVVLALATAGMICLSGCGGPGSKTPEPPPPITKDFDVNSAVTWMSDQINPKTNLIRSFQNLPAGDPSNGVTWIYNQTQAIEGFLAAGEVSEAKRLADGLLALQGADGAWYNAYVTDTGSVATNLFEQYTRWVGPNVVVGRALVDVSEATGDGKYTAAAMKLTGWLDKYFVDRGSYGYLTGGVGVSWTSTEHNMRAMAFYDRVGDKPRADLIAAWLNTEMYNPREKRYYVGYSSGETVNTNSTMATDVQYLGVLMAQHGNRDPQTFAGGIDWLLEHQTAIVLDNQGLVGIPRWLNVGNSLWFEGIGELAGALQILGREEEIDKFLSSIKVVQASDGSLPEAIGGTSGWPGEFPYSAVASVGSDIAAVLGDPRHMARPLAGVSEPSLPENELRTDQLPTAAPQASGDESTSSPVAVRHQLIGAITALSLLWGAVVPAANALEMSVWEKYDEPTERARMVNRIALGIINLEDERTGLAPSHLGHPGFEKLKFVYDAAVDALVLKAAGKQKEAEKILDYFADRLAIPLQEVVPYTDTNGIAGILKVWKTDEFNVRGLINALDRTSTKPRGQGMLEYYSTPGPMAFIVMAFLNVNKERYLPAAVELGNALLSLQRPDGGLKDGDRSPTRIHIEPHMDSFATFLQIYQATNDTKWKTAAEKAWQFFIKSDAYHPQEGIIWQGIWEFGTNKVFATDTYSWTMAGPAGDRMSLFELEKFTETMLSKSLTQVTLELPDGKTRTVVLVDFTDPKDPQIIKERDGFHPMGSVEWAGGVIAALQKNAVRFWEKGNPQQKETARHYKALAGYLIANSLYAFYEIPGLEGLLSFYATGQNVQTGHGWRTPFFYVKGPGVTIKGGSLVSAWPVLPIQGLNPFEPRDAYKKSYDRIPLSIEDKERAIRFVALSVVNRSFKEPVPTRAVDAATQIVEPGNYNLQMWGAFVRGDYKKSIEWAQRVVNDPDWIRLAQRDQEQKAKEIGGLVRYPWGTPPASVPDLETAIWRYPLLNEVAAAMWGLAASNFELGNRKEAKKWMRRIIEEIPYHQIYAPDGPGYWNALISWEYNPGNVRRDAQMGVLYREVLREMGISSAAPKEISVRGPQILPVAPESQDKLPVEKKTPPPISEPKPKVETKARENVWLRGSPGEYVSRQWQARATYADFDPPLKLQKGQKIKISYSLTGSDVLGIQLIPIGVDENMRGDMIVKRGVGGSDRTLIIEVPSDRRVWRIAFQYGNNAWGPLGGSVDAVIRIHAVEIYDEQHSGLGAGTETPASSPMGETFDDMTKEVLRKFRKGAKVNLTKMRATDGKPTQLGPVGIGSLTNDLMEGQPIKILGIEMSREVTTIKARSPNALEVRTNDFVYWVALMEDITERIINGDKDFKDGDILIDPSGSVKIIHVAPRSGTDTWINVSEYRATAEEAMRTGWERDLGLKEIVARKNGYTVWRTAASSPMWGENENRERARADINDLDYIMGQAASYYDFWQNPRDNFMLVHQEDIDMSRSRFEDFDKRVKAVIEVLQVEGEADLIKETLSEMAITLGRGGDSAVYGKAGTQKYIEYQRRIQEVLMHKEGKENDLLISMLSEAVDRIADVHSRYVAPELQDQFLLGPLIIEIGERDEFSAFPWEFIDRENLKIDLGFLGILNNTRPDEITPTATRSLFEIVAVEVEKARYSARDGDNKGFLGIANSWKYGSSEFNQLVEMWRMQRSNGGATASSPMIGHVEPAPGGIDFNPALLDLQIKRDGNGIPLPLPQQPIEDMHIEGFLPIIINITPVTNLPLLLGFADTKQDVDEITPAMKAREPEEVSYLN